MSIVPTWTSVRSRCTAGTLERGAGECAIVIAGRDETLECY